MNAEEFFERVESSLGETKCRDPSGCDYFISDMDELFDDWNEKAER